MTYRLICTRHFLKVQIDPIDSDTVRVTCEVNRRIKNIGSSPEEVRTYLHIDDWGFKEPSKILDCRVELENGKKIMGAPQTRTDSTVLFEGKPVLVKPGKHVTAVSKWSEVRRVNDYVYFHFRYPTLNPEIEVPPVQGLKITHSFGTASSETEEVSTGREVVRGTYMPLHHMVVRWWPESNFAQQKVRAYPGA